MSQYSEHCRPLASPDPFAVSLASFLVFGIFVSYLPQHAKIINRRTSEGLSPWWVLLGGLSSIAAIGNILVLPTSRADIGCCKELNGGTCVAAPLGVVQIGCQWACFMFIVMLFLIFFPTEAPADLSVSVGSLTSHSPSPKRRDQIIVGVATLIGLLVVGVTSIALVAAWPQHTQGWANILGTVAGVLAAIQYLPQIWYTVRLGDVMSLSIVTMLIRVPGAFVFAFSLWLRVGWEGWSTWLTYVITGILQGMLLGLAISYWLAGRKHEKDGSEVGGLVDDFDGADDIEEEEEIVATEHSPLLGGQDGTSNGKATVKKPVKRNGTLRSGGSNRQLDMLYAATPPEHDSDLENGEQRGRSRRPV